MLRIKLFDGNYIVRFRHDTYNRFSEAALHYGYDVEDSGKVIYEEVPTYIATSLCHPKDQFTKKTGRKVALARLLEWMSHNRFDLTEEDRREIWELYFASHRK